MQQLNLDTHLQAQRHPTFFCPAQKKEKEACLPPSHAAAYLNNLSLQCREQGKKREERRREKGESIKGHYISEQQGVEA